MNIDDKGSTIDGHSIERFCVGVGVGVWMDAIRFRFDPLSQWTAKRNMN